MGLKLSQNRVHNLETGVKSQLGQDIRRWEAGDRLQIRSMSQAKLEAGAKLEFRNHKSDAKLGCQEIKHSEAQLSKQLPVPTTPITPVPPFMWICSEKLLRWKTWKSIVFCSCKASRLVFSQSSVGADLWCLLWKRSMYMVVG